MSRRAQDDAHMAIRPFLSARPGELEPAQARQLTEHLSRCPACTAEAAGFHRLALALAAMRELELEPPPGLLDGLVAVAFRRRPVIQRGLQLQKDPRLVAAAAGAGGALVATAVVAGVLRSRRRETSRPSRVAALTGARRQLSGARPALARLLRRPALDVPVLGAAPARAR